MFEDRFWTQDYAVGVAVLFRALRNGCAEVNELLEHLEDRVRSERVYVKELEGCARTRTVIGRVRPQVAKAFLTTTTTNSGAIYSVRSAIDALFVETTRKAEIHDKIADRIEGELLGPLQTFSFGYERRVYEAEASLRTAVSEWQHLTHKCERLEEKLAQRVEMKHKKREEPCFFNMRLFKDMYPKADHLAKDADRIGLAGLQYSRNELSKLIDSLTTSVIQTTHKIPFLGEYENVSTGAAIAAASRVLLKNDSLAYSEKFGQSLVDSGFLKPVGQIMGKFYSSTSSYYQWQDLAFDLAGELDEPAGEPSQTKPLEEGSNDIPPQSSVPPQSSIPPQSHGLSPSSSVSPVDLALEEYHRAIIDLDKFRCQMELDIHNVYCEMERHERARVKVVQSVISQFTSISENRNEIQIALETLDKAENAVDVDEEINRLVLENQTAPYIPTVKAFQRLTGGPSIQTFGVNLAESYFFVPHVLKYLESLDQRPDLAAWTEPYDLEKVFQLRAQVNTGEKFHASSLLRFYPPGDIVGLVKQYLLELPEPLISSVLCDSIRSMYTENKSSASEKELQGLLRYLSPHSIKVLKKLVSYLVSYNEPEKLSEGLALCLSRPHIMTWGINIDQRPKQLVFDLLKNHEVIETFEHDTAPRTPQVNTNSAVFASPMTPSPKSDRTGKNVLLPLALSEPETQTKERSPRIISKAKGLGIGGLPIKPSWARDDDDSSSGTAPFTPLQ